MGAAIVQSLLDAVRRRLWWAQLAEGVRRASWASAALMLLAVAIHLTIHPVNFEALLVTAALLWTCLLAWAALLRPADADCALWADRHLNGASAYSTLLELRSSSHFTSSAQAAQWLERWAVARVPEGLRLLAQQRDAMRLWRPSLSMLVCAALAGFILTLSDVRVGATKSPGVATPTTLSEASAKNMERAAPSELVSEIAAALRSRDVAEMAQRPGSGGTTAGESAGEHATSAAPTSEPRSTARERDTPDSSDAGQGPTVGAASAGSTTRTSGGSSGREAGDSPGDRGNAGASSVPRSTMSTRQREMSTPPQGTNRQADMDELASFDEEAKRERATARPARAPLPATPPPAIETTRLSPTQAAYVQAWMKASAPRH